ncbi:hypothetical protein GLOIN_2v1482231 [Rhizophagus irregularis DAOM 181602=DAOM 197198]|uniref:Uncharacterized protein n=1 Tax=Rhizophagus irregularis (strain DAOM 181602 / DAOM 197198 / MUCL 43194) TaxID=747089 RepID=A0A2P4PMI5_RHIID|nr:hypothetical protein GLOIN_2v1482231 [Rhizophagus irregularis DAOM 181602=DAOM 197198]POG66569.1 hypothetical protein GLOIN_2v1482231 [Rhizophagus irregularis DAOM 181602=DAOM 197198]|eukprot:XP_025173435.1 hypothetical protein GLOIN_2v1482231 [Rhizophagus irregularis DAOM 181602=DAOM 197198]
MIENKNKERLSRASKKVPEISNRHLKLKERESIEKINEPDTESESEKKSNKGYNYGNPSFDNEDYNRNNDKPSLDNKDYDEEDNKGDIEIKSNCSKTSEISSYISKENDELMDDNKKFEKSEITKMSNERAEELQYRNTYFQNKKEKELYADIFDGL